MRLPIVASFLLVSCSRPAPPIASTVDASAPVPSTEPPDAAALAAKAVLAASSLQEAFVAAGPLFVKGPPEVDVPGGGMAAVGLASWAANHLSWIDVAVTKNETSFGMVTKDPVGERGKRVCLRGRLDHIKAMRSDRGTFYDCHLRTAEGPYVLFAVGSTGRLTDGAEARFCGAVVSEGRYTAPDGPRANVAAVGMFDLPENRDGG